MQILRQSQLTQKSAQSCNGNLNGGTLQGHRPKQIFLSRPSSRPRKRAVMEGTAGPDIPDTCYHPELFNQCIAATFLHENNSEKA
jgi:hypothetical protein